MNILICPRLFVSIFLALSIVSCGKQNSPGPTVPGVQNPKPGMNSQVLVKSADVVMDRKQGIPRFVATNPISFKNGISVKFELDELTGIPFKAREDFLVPFFNGEEIWNGQWPMDSVEHYADDVATTISFTADRVSFFESRLRRNPEIGTKDLTFMLRVVFSDSIRVSRNTLAVVEVPLVR